MSTDSTARTTPAAEYSEPRKSQPAMYCSECKAIMRMMYYSLDERPLCQKCGAMYKARIEQGTGPGAMSRAVLYGTGAAIVGMIGVAAVLSIFNGFRIITAIGVAYLVAKAIGKVTGNYGGRRYQVLAVGLTYVALGLAMLVPVFRAMHALEKVTAPPKLEARYGPAGERAQFDDEIRALNAAPRENEDPAETQARADSLAAADSVHRLEEARTLMKAKDGNAAVADRLAGGGRHMIIGAITLIVILPILGAFSYGLYAGVFGIMALGFGMKKAWELTGIVTDYHLTGPFQVGTGPIAPTVGG